MTEKEASSHQTKSEGQVEISNRVNLNGALIGKLRLKHGGASGDEKGHKDDSLDLDKDSFYHKLSSKQLKLPRARLANPPDSASAWRKLQLEPVDEVIEAPVFWSDDEGRRSRIQENSKPDELDGKRRPKTLTALKSRIVRHQKRRVVLDVETADTETDTDRSESATDSQLLNKIKEVRPPRRKSKLKSLRAKEKKNSGSSNAVADSSALEYHSIINPDVTYKRKQNDAQKGRLNWSLTWSRGWNEAAWLRDELLTKRARKYHSLSRDGRRIFWLTEGLKEVNSSKQQQFAESSQGNAQKTAAQVGAGPTEVNVVQKDREQTSTERFRQFWSRTEDVYSPVDDTQATQAEDIAAKQGISQIPSRLYLRNPKRSATPAQYQLRRNYGYF